MRDDMTIFGKYNMPLPMPYSVLKESVFFILEDTSLINLVSISSIKTQSHATIPI